MLHIRPPVLPSFANLVSRLCTGLNSNRQVVTCLLSLIWIHAILVSVVPPFTLQPLSGHGLLSSIPPAQAVQPCPETCMTSHLLSFSSLSLPSQPRILHLFAGNYLPCHWPWYHIWAYADQIPARRCHQISFFTSWNIPRPRPCANTYTSSIPRPWPLSSTIAPSSHSPLLIL